MIELVFPFFTTSAHYLHITSFIDLAELLCCSLFVYKVTLWLKSDHTKPLLPYFYGYLTALCVTFMLPLPLIHLVLICAAPVVATTLIVYHHKMLQKNFMFSHKYTIKAAKIAKKEWAELLIRSCMKAAHQHGTITCIIQGNDTLDHYIQTPFLLHVPVQKNMLNVLLESSAFNHHQAICVSYLGNLISINTTWSDTIINDLPLHLADSTEEIKACGHIITKHTDAFLIHFNTKTNQHCIISQGKVIQDLSIEQILQFMKKLLYKKDIEQQTVSGETHDPSTHNLTPPTQN